MTCPKGQTPVLRGYMESETLPDTTPERSGTTGGSGTAGRDAPNFCEGGLKEQFRNGCRAASGGESDMQQMQEAPKGNPTMIYTGRSLSDDDQARLLQAENRVGKIFFSLLSTKDPRLVKFAKRHQRLADSLNEALRAVNHWVENAGNIFEICWFHDMRILPSQYRAYKKASEELADLCPDIRRQMNAATEIVSEHLQNNGTLFCGTSRGALDEMLSGGDVGCLVHQKYTKGSLDFIKCSASLYRARARSFGVVVKYDVSGLTDADVRPVQHQVRNRTEHLFKRYAFGMQFGKQDGCVLINGDVHLKKNARPKVRQIEFSEPREPTHGILDKIRRHARMQEAPIKVTWPKGRLDSLESHPDLHSMVVDATAESG